MPTLAALVALVLVAVRALVPVLLVLVLVFGVCFRKKDRLKESAEEDGGDCRRALRNQGLGYSLLLM